MIDVIEEIKGYLVLSAGLDLVELEDSKYGDIALDKMRKDIEARIPEEVKGFLYPSTMDTESSYELELIEEGVSAYVYVRATSIEKAICKAREQYPLGTIKYLC